MIQSRDSKAGRVFQPLVVENEPLDEVLLEPGRGPLAELDTALRTDAVADGEDGLQAVMLDLAVREASHSQASLREVLQWMNENYAKKDRFFNDSEGVREAAETVSHADLTSFFTKYVAGTEEIPWDDFFRPVGLRVEAIANNVPDAGFMASRNFDGPMSVAAITPGSAAEHAGLQVGDTIVELQGKPAGQESRQVLAELSPGDTLAVKVRSRRGAERELKWKVGSRQEISYEIKDLDQVTSTQRERRVAWLKGEALSASPTSAGPPTAATPTGAVASGVRQK